MFVECIFDVHLGKKINKGTKPNCTVIGKGKYGLEVACKISFYE